MNSGSVVVALRGGIGNQLFQYAAGVAVASRMNAEVAFRRVEAESVRLDEVLQRDLPEASPTRLRQLGVIGEGRGVKRGRDRVHRRLVRARGNVKHLTQHWRDAMAPMPDDLFAPNTTGLYLDGYFQHPSWFEPSLAIVADRLAHRLNQFGAGLSAEGATAVSFRRGDYVRLGWDLPLSYYDEALALLSDASGPIWVVGDDVLTTQLFESRLRHSGARAGEPPDLGEGRFLRDLALLSAATHVVMSNSTYCWWGVNAGDPELTRSDRTVVAPAPWLPLSGADSLVRPGWLSAATRPEWAPTARAE